MYYQIHQALWVLHGSSLPLSNYGFFLFYPCRYGQLIAHQGAEKYRKNRAGDRGKAGIGTGDSGVFLSCDLGKEAKCMADALDIFSQV
jgi:hypothetical protein